jgi:hypothetical protein
LEEDVQGESLLKATAGSDFQKALEDQEQRKTNAVDKLAQRYKELEDQKQARKVVFVDKMTAPTRGKAARGRQGGMVIVKAGQARRTSPLIPVCIQAE